MTYLFIDEGRKHVHTLDGQPLYGTSTIVKDVMPPFLAKWGGQCAVDYIKERYEKEPVISPEIFERAVNAYTSVRDKAADKGTDMHAELENYVNQCIENGGSPLGGVWAHKAVQQFSEWSLQNVQAFIFAEKHTYSRELWVGGIVDCVARLKTGEIAVVDFKSSKEVYFNHLAQTGGYALELEETGAFESNGAGFPWKKPEESIGALVVVPFGSEVIKPVKVTNVQGFKDVFRNLVSVYTMMQAFNKSKTITL